jgi:protoheme IX farnesyltransferase
MTDLTLTQLNALAGPRLGDYLALLKPRVMSLVVFSGVVGLAVAPGELHPVLAFTAILCIALSAGGSAAINMWYDRDIDAIMRRTQQRPLPQGTVTPQAALELGWGLIAASTLLMGLAVNWLAATLLLGAALFYIVIYTMGLKRRTPQNIVIGGAAGAFPPVIAWSAVTGQLEWQAWILFLIIFFWTPPHFWALALYRNEDYTRAGVPMLPVVKGVRRTKLEMIIYTLILLPVSLLPAATGLGGTLYLVGAALLSTGFIVMALRVWRDATDQAARQMFGYSIIYLSALLSLLLIERLTGLMQ